jgi:pimeloyl-ACP methyl ester carboxylesterase
MNYNIRKPDLILLHGALGSQVQFSELSKKLSSSFTIHTFNFSGYGGRPIDQAPSIELFSQNLIDYIVENDLVSPFVFGYSMGGYVALNARSIGIAMEKLMTLGTKFAWTPEGAAKEIKLLNPEVIEVKVPHFATHLTELHAPDDWKIVMRNTVQMMTFLGNNPNLTDEKLKNIELETLCCLGSNDNMVSREETEHAVSQLSNGSLHIFEGMEHPIEKVDIDLLSAKIENFFLS